MKMLDELAAMNERLHTKGIRTLAVTFHGGDRPLGPRLARINDRWKRMKRPLPLLVWTDGGFRTLMEAWGIGAAPLVFVLGGEERTTFDLTRADYGVADIEREARRLLSR
ncbi:MAG: hypothetical protein K2W96_27750 [Gemmataceae bacterium]|nr:hypothetical protein [Gemmataceae bacterium]